MYISSLQTRRFLDAIKCGKVEQAIRFANEISLKDPQNPLGYAMVGDALKQRGDNEQAETFYQYSLAIKPDQPQVHVALGESYLLTGETDKAYQAYYDALQLAPESPIVLDKIGHFLISMGRLNDANNVLSKSSQLGCKDSIKSILELKIHQGDKKEIAAYLGENKQLIAKDSLTLAKAFFSLGDYHSVIRLLLKEDSQSFSAVKKAYHAHLLGAAYEKLGQYRVAMDFFNKQNSLSKAHYMPEKIQQRVQSIIQMTELMDVSQVQYKDVTEQEFSPLFVIGLPRSGTSLLEQILNTSEHVVAGGELLFVEAAYKKYTEQKMPLEDISAWYRHKIEFITKNQEIPKEAPRWLTDKMPSNFVNVGFIKKMIPDAKFIYCKRNPMDNGFSIYKQHFMSTHSYATKLEDIAHFIHLERTIMQHWQDTYPGLIHEVCYESLVADFSTESQKLFDYAELNWTPKVKQFYKNNHYCNTASFDQVRQPLNSDSVLFYKNYEQQLAPLQKALLKEDLIN